MKKAFSIEPNPNEVYTVVNDHINFKNHILKPLSGIQSAFDITRRPTNFEISNASILGRTNIILNKNSVGSLNNITFNPKNSNKIFCDDEADFSINDGKFEYIYSDQIKIKKAIFIGTNLNFGHWLHNHLARVLQFELVSFYDFSVIISDSAPQVHIDSLCAAGFDVQNIVRIKRNQIVEVENLIIPQMPWHRLGDTVWWTPDIFAHFRNRLGVGHANLESGRRKVFISRKIARWRRLINEDEIYEILSQEGYERIFLENMTYSDQVNLAKNTQCLISPFGAGSNFFMFMPSGSMLIELSPPLEQMDINGKFCSACNIEYRKIEGRPSPQVGQNKLDSDYFIDPLLLDSFI